MPVRFVCLCVLTVVVRIIDHVRSLLFRFVPLTLPRKKKNGDLVRPFLTVVRGGRFEAGWRAADGVGDDLRFVHSYLGGAGGSGPSLKLVALMWCQPPSRPVISHPVTTHHQTPEDSRLDPRRPSRPCKKALGVQVVRGQIGSTPRSNGQKNKRAQDFPQSGNMEGPEKVLALRWLDPRKLYRPCNGLSGHRCWIQSGSGQLAKRGPSLLL
ncbi:hypothetical protein PDE_05206 [Penicillium oxalicum 114-2]|uniref:Secreted protein n=1 Tax=Penicillium oxalicum (strain 114-2 / CGMCC 5302) TaxID=933388 RepID=S7ZHX1_PENO1|nr:hypothetical protein PDE_05206 [Penicillium oxalicum 114-2]